MNTRTLLVAALLLVGATTFAATPALADPCPQHCTPPPQACTHIDGPLAREVCVPSCWGYKTIVQCAADQLP